MTLLVSIIVLSYLAGYLEGKIQQAKASNITAIKEKAVEEGVLSTAKIYNSILILNGFLIKHGQVIPCTYSDKEKDLALEYLTRAGYL